VKDLFVLLDPLLLSADLHQIYSTTASHSAPGHRRNTENRKI
jgi:hypothetical protein